MKKFIKITMNEHLKHELLTWGIFLGMVLILVYPIYKLAVYLHLSYGVIAVLSILTGMLFMLVVEWFTKKILKR